MPAANAPFFARDAALAPESDSTGTASAVLGPPVALSGAAGRQANGKAMPPRQRLLAGSVGAALLLATAVPAQADLTDGEIRQAIQDAVEEIFAPIIEAIITPVADLPVGLAREQLGRLLALIGLAPRSYLPDGADLDELFPDDPMIYAPDEASFHAEERSTDRKQRVEEAMGVAAGVTAAIPAERAQLVALDGLNQSPASIFAGIQIGNAIGLSAAEALQAQNALLAELGQLEADQRAQEDWSRRQYDHWARHHYGASGYWQGARAWRPETMRVGW